MSKFKYTESMTDFLARGGKITFIPSGPSTVSVEYLRKTAAGSAVLLTMDEHALYHGDKEKVKKSLKKVVNIDLNALPDALKKKYLMELRDEEAELDDDH